MSGNLDPEVIFNVLGHLPMPITLGFAEAEQVPHRTLVL
jgi:hypothetical protein